MSVGDAATLGAAWLAVLVSLAAAALALRQNSKIATLGRLQAHDARQSEAVIHFTGRYHDLMRDGDQFDDERWSGQYWGLMALEFFYFDQGWIPNFVYELWVIELVSRGYQKSPAVWESHRRHLVDLYSVAYPEMTAFFVGLHEISEGSFLTPQLRNEAVVGYVQGYRDQPSAFRNRRPITKLW